LQQHPDAFFSPYKEPNYFALAGMKLPTKGPGPDYVREKLLYGHSLTGYQEYLRLFENSRGFRAVGEGSVRYLYYKEAPARIHEKIPNVRLIAVLRNPIDRLYSHF